MLASRAAASNMAGDGEGFAEKSFFEYHLYTLGRPATIPDRSTKQVELFPTAHTIPVEKVLVYAGLDNQFNSYWPSPMMDQNFGVQSKKDVDVYLQLAKLKGRRHGHAPPRRTHPRQQARHRRRQPPSSSARTPSATPPRTKRSSSRWATPSTSSASTQTRLQYQR